MSGCGGGDRGRRERRRGYGPSGFEEAGGYMAAKIAKLERQYEDSADAKKDISHGLFKGIAIFVNGYTEPTGEELKRIMMVNGGTYHHYYSRSKTTHIIASNLPDTKVKNMNTDRIVSPKWITDSLQAGYVLDYTKYLLYTNQTGSQPKLSFKPSKTEGIKNSFGETLTEGKNCKQNTKSVTEIKEYEVKDQSLNLNTYSPDKKDGLNVIKPGESPTKTHAMSTANPKFLSEFYNNSRLHHISTMGAIFKQYVNEMKKGNNDFPGRKRLLEWLRNSQHDEILSEDIQDFRKPNGSKKRRVIMHIDMDCFFVSVGLRNHPNLRGKPVAVTHAKGNSTQVHEGRNRQYELNYYKERAEKKIAKKIKASNQVSVLTTEINDISDDESANKPEAPSTDKKFSSLPLIDETCSMSEIASCSYEARKAGVKNGMFLGPALKLCPNLHTIPYDFEGYKEVSYKLYDIVASYTHDIEAVSCDEMFVDLSEILSSCEASPEEFASLLRKEIQDATRCPCSAGMGPNMLIARMATRLAKPNGQCLANPDDFVEYMKDHKVSELPGVGWSLGKRLESEGIRTCKEMQAWSLGQLQSAFGSRTGQSLYNYCRGIDDRQVKSEHLRKSVSAEVNYGIRFTCTADAEKFIRELSEEVASRLTNLNLKGKCITLKLKVRAKDAPVETAKFMGHGVCDNIAKSVSITSATSSPDKIERETLSLLRQVKAPPQDFRGVGIQISRLEGHNGSSGVSSSNKLSSVKSFFLAAKTSSTKTESAKQTKECTSSTFPSSNKREERNLFEPQPGPSGLQSKRQEVCKSSCDMSRLEDLDSGKGTVDLDVLMALPEHMRNQVISEYEQQGYTIPVAAKSPQKSNYNKNSSEDNISVEKHTPVEVENVTGSNCENSEEGSNMESEDLITSFSQVDSSFLDAIPADLREELRQDFEQKKQATASKSVATSHLLAKSKDTFPMPLIQAPVKRENKVKSKRGRPSKLDQRSATKQGLTTLTSLLQGTSTISSSRNDAMHGVAYKKTTNKQGRKKEDNCTQNLMETRTKYASPPKTVMDVDRKSVTPEISKGEQLVTNTEEIPHLCGVTEMKEVKALIHEWVTSCPCPEAEDAEILAYYYTRLIIHHELETLDLLIKYLLREVRKIQNKYWNAAFQNVVACVQKCMLEHFNAKLKVNLL